MSFPSLLSFHGPLTDTFAYLFPTHRHTPHHNPLNKGLCVYIRKLETVTLSSQPRLLKEKGSFWLPGREITLTQSAVLNVRSWLAASVLKGDAWMEVPLPGLCPWLVESIRHSESGTWQALHGPWSGLAFLHTPHSYHPESKDQVQASSKWGKEKRKVKTKQLSFFQLLLQQ